MAENEVEVNLNALCEDIEKLQAAVQQMDDKVKNVFDAVGELGRMWEGPEKEGFLRQIESDYQSCQEREYRKCEQRIDDLVEAVRI